MNNKIICRAKRILVLSLVIYLIFIVSVIKVYAKADVTVETETVETAAAVASVKTAGVAAAEYQAEVTCESLNVRSGAGSKYGVIGTIKAGQIVDFYGKKNNWYKINYNGTVGYASTKYLKEILSSQQWMTTTIAIVRSGPGAGYSFLGFAGKNTVFDVTSSTDGWHQINYKDQTGYISAASLKDVNAQSSALLDVPLIAQRPELPTGCEITSVTMMLQYKGCDVNKIDLANEMPKSSDPNKGYSGNPFRTSGWTIYPSALIGLITKYTGGANDLTGSIDMVYTALNMNKPVVAWVKMHGFSVHAITLTGYDSDCFYYNDPWTAEKNVLISKSDFLKLWNTQAQRAITY